MVDLTPFIHAVNKEKKVPRFHGLVLALDPGETTGYAVFKSRPSGVGETASNAVISPRIIGQVRTWPPEECVKSLTELFNTHRPDIVVNESYHIYSWHAEDHKWSPVNTIQIIGCIWTLCHQRNIPRVQQSAQNAKSFWTDEKLKHYQVYEPGKPHGRDATRHALHFLSFGATATTT
jgi:hypothetical protein